ncbi:MAG TPA: lactate utilization protein [Terriglobia bacterium]|nr:lactate utilization protein [Terriglobia bacterium]
MLARIREALGAGASSTPPDSAGPTEIRLEGVLPPIPSAELVPRFEEELRSVGGTCYRASTLADLDGIIRSVLTTSAATPSVVLSRHPLLGQLHLAERLRGLGISVAEYPDAALESPTALDQTYREQCFAAAAGITGVDFALAESGSLVLSSVTEGSQLASLAPPVHIALYRPQQAVAFLEELLDALPVERSPNAPSPGRSVVFVTGPSRTADIEQILIRGVHGPREVHAILVEDSCLA